MSMGRVIRDSQRCLLWGTLPNFLQGATERAQQCQTKNAPTIFIWCRDYLAEMPLLTRTKGRAKILLQKCHVTKALPNQLQGFNAQSQKCHNAHNPRGPKSQRRNASTFSPPPNLGQQSDAEMPKACRPITRGHPEIAAMP